MPSLPSSASSGLNQLRQTASGLQVTADKLHQNGEKLLNQATTPGVLDQPAQPGSAAPLDSITFLQRAQQGGVASSKPAGLSLTVQGSASANLPFLEASTLAQNPTAIPDLHLSGGGQIDVRFSSREQENGSGFYLGLRGDLSAAGRTQGIPDALATAEDLMGRAESLQGQMTTLQNNINTLATQLQNSPSYQRMEHIITQLRSNPASIHPSMLQELKQILNSGEIQGLLQNLNANLGEVNRLLGDASGFLGVLGDGRRQLSAEAAVRGAAEIYGGYRTPGIPLGDSKWKVRFGIEAAAIIPLPAPAQPTDTSLPSFKYAMAKVAATAQLTTRGLGQIQQRLEQLQSNLSTLGQALGNTTSAVHSAAQVANQVDPNHPLSLLGQLGQIQQTLSSLEQAAMQASSAGQALQQNLDALADDMGQAEIKPALGLTTISPTAPVGFGIRDMGMDLYGPITEKVQAHIEAGIMNPIGFLQGEENRYQLEKTSEGELHLQKTHSQKRNVFHDFYDPAIYAGVGVTAHANSPLRTDLKLRVEQSLNSDILRASAILRQQTGPISFSTGILNADMRNSGKNMYMVGMGFGKHDIFSIQAATNSFSPSKVTDVQVQAGFRIPF